MAARPVRIARPFALAPLTVAVLVLAACGGGSASAPTPEEDSPTPPSSLSAYGAYTLLAPSSGGGTLVIARVVVDDGVACPTLSGGGTLITTRARAKPTHPVHFAQRFPVTVCEAVVPFGQTLSVNGTSIELGAVTTNPGRVLVYGDTGCKHCQDGDAATPFDQLASSGAALFTPSTSPPAGWTAPALILHMGDMNYRGTGWSVEVDGKKQPVYDAGDMVHTDKQCRYESDYYSQNAGDSTTPDRWDYWHDDLFRSAVDLLPTAPWVFARGNHELCSRAGPGWFYFLGPGADGWTYEGAIPQTTCPDQGLLSSPPANAYGQIVTVEPYAVDLGWLRVVSVDSANACDGFADNTTMTAQYKGHFETAASLVADGKDSWVMTHRPIWGIEKYSGDYARMNAMMQAAISGTTTGALPGAVKLSLAGHQHNFESLTFDKSAGRPPQIVVGNSGVALGGSQLVGDFCLEVDGRQANGGAADGCKTCTQTYGFLDLVRQSDGSWKGPVSNPGAQPTPTTVAECHTTAEPVCTLTPSLGGSGCAPAG